MCRLLKIHRPKKQSNNSTSKVRGKKMIYPTMSHAATKEDLIDARIEWCRKQIESLQKPIIEVKRIHKDAIIPTLGHEHDAGLDLYCLEDIEIFHDEQLIIPTGLHIAIPEGWAGIIWPRSGLTTKSRIDRRAGLIDPPYRKELKVVLVNETFKSHKFEKGDRIAQLICVPVTTEIKEVDKLSETGRGGGFGSTGK